jgi:hypothetical protein
MKPDRLEAMLAAYAAQPLPPLSVAPTAGVWLEIENRRRQSWWARLFPVLDWRESFTEPRMAFAALALAVTVGVVPAMALNHAENKRELVRQSIRFDVFSSNTGSLGSVFAKPASLMANAPR